MHTLLIHQGFMTPKDAGGTRHYELAQFAVAQGDHFSVVTGDFSYMAGKGKSASLVGDQEDVDGICVLRVATPRSLHGGFIGQLFSFVSFAAASFAASMRVRDVDVVLGTSPPIFQAVTAWLVAAIRGRPLILEIRDLWPEFIVDMGKLKNPIAIGMARWLERFLYRRAHHFIVNSPAYVDYLISKRVDSSKITLIPNGVDPSMFEVGLDVTSAAQALRERFNLVGKFVVMYAGAMGPANDLTVLLDAASLLRDDPDVHVMLVGGGKIKAKLEAYASERSLTNVTFAGPQSKIDMRAFLQTADVCVATLQDIAMFRMTYPNKVFDYLAAGRPIVLGIDGVIRRVVEDANAGVFVQPGDPHALASAIRDFASNPQRGEALGRNGREFVAHRFNRRDHGEAFAALLRQMAPTK